MPLQPESNFSVKLGGTIFSGVVDPVTVNDQPVFTFYRDTDTRALAVSFKLLGPRGGYIATVTHNAIGDYDAERYELIKTVNRFALRERSSGNVVCEITAPRAPDRELEIYFALLWLDHHRIYFHPNRIRFFYDGPSGAVGRESTDDRIGAVRISRSTGLLNMREISSIDIGLRILGVAERE